MRNRTLLLGGLLAALLLAGVGSHYASSSPDGLEYVAEATGFAGTAEPHAGADGPLADYRVDGVGDDRLARGLAGVVGVVVTLLLAAGLTWLLHRRQPDPSASGDH